MDFLDFIHVIVDDVWFNVIMYFVILALYFYLFRNRLWSILDPLSLHVLVMGSAAYCVFVLGYYELVPVKYIYSFIITELAFMVGFFSLRRRRNRSVILNDNNDLPSLIIFVNVVWFIYFIAQLVTYRTVGFILFEEGKNHAFAFEEHGVLRVFLNNSKALFLFAVFYKRHVVGKFSYWDMFMIAFAVAGSILGGSRSAIIGFFSIYIIVNYIYSVRNNTRRLKIPVYIYIGLVVLVVLIVSLKGGSGILDSLGMLSYRFIGSGDVFVLGYNDAVIASIQEKSGLKYIFWPGLGTFFKWFFGATPPSIIGVDINEYYTGMRDSGPNARHNYLAMYFWGYYGAIFSFIVGLLVSWVRNVMAHQISKARFEILILLCNVIYLITDIITDANLFMNQFFWAIFMFLFAYMVSNFISLFLTKDFSDIKLTLKNN